MSETKFTPGRWAFRALRGDDGLGYIEADGYDIIHAGVSDLSREENEANAHLIAKPRRSQQSPPPTSGSTRPARSSWLTSSWTISRAS
jgi:hypothetical protein